MLRLFLIYKKIIFKSYNQIVCSFMLLKPSVLSKSNEVDRTQYIDLSKLGIETSADCKIYSDFIHSIFYFYTTFTIYEFHTYTHSGSIHHRAQSI